MYWVERFGLIKTFTFSMCAVGLILIAYAWMNQFLLAACLFGLLGIPNAMNNVAMSPLILEVTPSTFVGRIFALLIPAWSSVFFLAILLSGALYSRIPIHTRIAFWGIRIQPLTILLTLTGMMVIIGGIYAIKGLKQTPIE